MRRFLLFLAVVNLANCLPTCRNGEFLATGVMYEFRDEARTCLAKKVTECVRELDDFESCGMITESSFCLGDSETETLCVPKEGDEHWCPAGLICVPYEMVDIEEGGPNGYCCNKEYEKETTPTCKNGKRPVMMKGENRALLGRSCADDFCPQDSTCIQLKNLAHCCR